MTIRLVPSAANANCSWPTGCPIDPVTGLTVYQDASCPFYFQDPLPAGARLRRIDVSAVLNPDQSSAGENVDVLLSEYDFGFDHVIASGTLPQMVFNCELPSFFAPGLTDPPAIIYGYGAQTINYVRLAGLAKIDYMDLTLHYDPPPTITFELTPSTDEKQRRVILHMAPADTDFFSDAQGRIGDNADVRGSRMEIKSRVTQGGVPLANRQVYVRVYDPPDPSPYFSAYSHAGDNNEGAILSATPLGLPVESVMTDNDGYARVILTAGGNSAGDNYQVEESVVPFADPTTFTGTCVEAQGCFRSGVITAWKRMYVETDYMFRQGAFLREQTAPPPVGQAQIIIVSDCHPFHDGDTIALIHGPRFGVVADGFYGEQAVVVQRRQIGGHGLHRCELTLSSPLQFPYFGPDLDQTGTREFLADAVGVVSGTTPFFSPNTSLLRDEFAKAYIDVVLNPVNVTYSPSPKGDPLSLVPHIAEMGSTLDTVQQADPFNEVEHREFAAKWLFDNASPNYLHVIGADSDFTNPNRDGLDMALDGQQYTYLYVGQIESVVKGANVANLNAELTVHETAHNWHVNPGPPDGVFGGGVDGQHCEYRNWEETSTCTGVASSSTSVITDTGTMVQTTTCQNTACPEWYDGRVEFHFKTRWNSEYTYMRWRRDPLRFFDELNALPPVK